MEIKTLEEFILDKYEKLENENQDLKSQVSSLTSSYSILDKNFNSANTTIQALINIVKNNLYIDGGMIVMHPISLEQGEFDTDALKIDRANLIELFRQFNEQNNKSNEGDK